MKLFDFDKLIDTLTSYIETKLELFKIDLKEELRVIVAKAFVYLSIILLSLLAIIFALGAFGGWLNQQLNSSYLGYLIDFGIVLFTLILVYTNKSKVINSIVLKMKKGEKKEELTDGQ